MNVEKISSDVSREKIKVNNEEQHYDGFSGDDDLFVRLKIAGKSAQIKSIVFSDGLKEFINQSPDDFWQVLSDLIIVAHLDAISKIENAEDENDNLENLDSEDILNQVTKMTKSMGGMDEMLKKMGFAGPNGGINKDILKKIGLGGTDTDALLKNMSSLFGSGKPKK
jgi:DNA-binding protein YbaB